MAEKLHAALAKFLPKKTTEEVPEMDKLLYMQFNDDPVGAGINTIPGLLNAIDKVTKCKLNRFPDNDGFYSDSYPAHLMTKQIFDGYYGHQYLDSRHLLTILKGSQDNSNYRQELRGPLRNMITEAVAKHGSMEDKLQIFTRLKMALYEGLKLDKESQEETKEIIKDEIACLESVIEI